ncbi:MAG: regulatory iron-sulfur-containing complex subunit RicT [Lentisphaeria bacterium]
MKYSYTIRIAPGIEYEAVADAALPLAPGTRVIVQCERYEDCGTVRTPRGPEPADEEAMLKAALTPEKGRPIQGNGTPVVLRIATPHDLQQVAENAERAAAMEATVQGKVHEHHLAMKLVSRHYVFDRNLLVIQFAADGRVDFRELLRDLSRTLRLRVELRQIGVRDETAAFGGFGCCGQPLCCSRFLHDFHSINVKLAKEQGLSLNPANISGACGRLKCCLRYEAEGYRDLRARLPRPGTVVETPEGRGRVVELLPLKQAVKVSLAPAAGGEGGSRLVELPATDLREIPAAPGPDAAGRD